MVHKLLELIINLMVHMTGHDIVQMESHCVLLANLYPISDTWMVSIEIKSSNFQLFTKLIME